MSLFGGAVLIAGGGVAGREAPEASRSPSNASSRFILSWHGYTGPTTTTPPTTAVVRQEAKPAPAPQPASPVDDAFWRRLANCESPNGANGSFNGYFQLSSDTAAKVGYHGGSYEEQLAAAKRWLAIIGVAKAGTRAGWPVCWWVAKRG